jgi:RND family efflux transporter MFP subunit
VRKSVGILIALIAIGGLAWLASDRLKESAASVARTAERGPAPVEVMPVELGPIELRRTFSGSLESPGRLIAAPKVSGRLERVTVDLGDEVRRRDVVAELDNEEFLQAVAQAEAELAVANANLVEAENGLEIARRELKRIRTLQEQNVASESELDVAKADQLAKESAVAVAKAQVKRAESELQTAKIRLGYTTVIADWHEGDDLRVVGERYVDEGETVAANARLMSIVELDPINAIITVTERDYARIRQDQPATIRTDAFPEETFSGQIDRIAPVFERGSRQARIEIRIPNTERRLKPGMFVRATVVLERVEETTIIPVEALVTRNDRQGVFRVNESDLTVEWQPVTLGIHEAGRVQVRNEELKGRVVTLGQQLLDDGSAIRIPGDQADDDGSST